MHMYNFLCSDSLLYFFLFLSTLHSVYTRDCSGNQLQEWVCQLLCALAIIITIIIVRATTLKWRMALAD